MSLILSAFFLFIFGSGLRIVAFVYPDPQWMLGLIAFAGFGLAIYFCRPNMPWVIEAEERFTEG